MIAFACAPAQFSRSVALGLLVFVVLPAGRAWAWASDGHKIIALIAFDELTPAARAKAIELLKQHPRYEADLLVGAPAGADAPAMERHAFAEASTWPDLVRSQSHPMHFVANHPQWHYIDIPYRPEGGTDQPADTQPARGNEREPGPRDIVEALTKNADDLRNPMAGGADKAVALCWILHLCGDIHQPLHAVELFSSQVPQGDKGGNALMVLRDPPYLNSQVNLHRLWDEAPGGYKDTGPIEYLARGLRTDPKWSRESLKDALAVREFAAWAAESHDLAVKNVYLNGTLKTAIAQHGDHKDAPAEIPGVPPGYMEQAEKISFRQLILAGHRTADLLNRLLAPGPG